MLDIRLPTYVVQFLFTECTEYRYCIYLIRLFHSLSRSVADYQSTVQRSRVQLKPNLLFKLLSNTAAQDQ